MRTAFYFREFHLLQVPTVLCLYLLLCRAVSYIVMATAGDIFNGQRIGLGAALVLLYLIGGAVYRLYLSPLAKFPGPKLAALTLWYNFLSDTLIS
jgi:hypothetical protein